MPRRHALCLLIALAVSVALPVGGSMAMMEQLTVDFTNAKEAGAKAEWSAGVEINEHGLGFDGNASTSREGWIMTKPLAVGTAWRPAQASGVSVEISPAPQPIKLTDGSTYTPYAGMVYARYSPDRKHWSSWQALESEASKPGDANLLKFHGNISVPQQAQTRYRQLCEEYAKLDVPWTSDEEATVRWIIAREPDFFDKELPFVGYLQFLYESDFRGGQWLRSFQARTGEGIGGMHRSPKDPAEYKKHEGPWRYAAPD